MREIKVTVNPDGSTTMDFSGFKGPTCLAEADKLRQLLANLGIQSEQTGFQAKPELESVLNPTTETRKQQEEA
jgi:hypothetical protein